MRKEFFFVAFEAGMLLKTNETGIEGAESNQQITENKWFNRIWLRILSMCMNRQEIEKKPVVDRGEVSELFRKNRLKEGLRHEFSRILMLPTPQFVVAE